MSVVGLAAPKPPSQVSAGISISGRNSTSGLNSISGSTLILRPPRARDRVTMAEDGPVPGRVTTGVGSVSRIAGTEPIRRTDRCDLRYDLDQSPYLLQAIIVKLLNDLGKLSTLPKLGCDFHNYGKPKNNGNILCGKRGN